MVAGDTCGAGSGSISGLAFYGTGSYPAAYQDALFFADASRNCIWVMFKGADGLPNPANRAVFMPGASSPVDLRTGPGGDLFYADREGGSVQRISYTTGNLPPTAVIQSGPLSGSAPLTVNFNGSASTDPQGGTLTYAWDLDGDGDFDDSTVAQPSFVYTQAGARTVRLKVTDPQGLSAVASVVVIVNDLAPTPTISHPGGEPAVERGPGHHLLGLGDRPRGRRDAGLGPVLVAAPEPLPVRLPHPRAAGLHRRGRWLLRRAGPRPSRHARAPAHGHRLPGTGHHHQRHAAAPDVDAHVPVEP